MSLTVEQKTSKLYKHYLMSGDTRTAREFFEEAFKSNFIIGPSQLWMYGDHIPCGDATSGGTDAVTKVKNLLGIDGQNTFGFWKTESEYVSVVKRFADYALSPVDKGTDNSFVLLDSKGNQIQNIIPFNYYEDVYNYKLKTSTGKEIYFGVGDWVLDCYSGILTFYGDLPEGIDHDNPPLISFYQYVGGVGFRQDVYGYEGAILPIENFYMKKGSYCTYKSEDDTADTLVSLIRNVSSIIEANFVDTYGWDGTDKNEGIALSLEPVIPLTYSKTKDAVKGYDDSANADLGVLLSNKSAAQSDSPVKISFISQGITYASISLKLTGTALTVLDADGNSIGSCTLTDDVDTLYKVELADGSFIVLEATGTLVDGTYSSTILTNIESGLEAVYALVVYWSSTDGKYLPLKLKEDGYYNIGFPVVTINGKIPPSVSMRSLTLGSALDTVTPEYYGPRTATVVISLEGYPQVKSTDYIVKNSKGYYLSDILDAVAADYSDGVVGTILLRPGEYIVNKNINLTPLGCFKLIAESYGKTVLKGTAGQTITFNGNTSDFTTFESLVFNNVNLKISTLTDIVTIKNTSWLDTASTLVVEKGASILNLISVKANSVSISSEINDDNHYTKIENCSITDLTLSEKNAIVSNTAVSGTLSNSLEGLVLLGCMVSTLDVNNQSDYVTPRGCVIHSWVKNNITYSQPYAGYLPIYSKSSDQKLRYAKFVDPLYYDEDKGEIQLKIDGAYFHLDDKGQLSCHLDATQIKVDSSLFKRQDTAKNADGTAIVSTVTTIQEALEELYYTKADLVDGKVPLQQLPDSVAYGGLLYVGSWQFETSKGAYPTFADIKANLGLSLDEEVTKLQPGWFVVIDASKVDSDYPAADQTATDGTVYTAGDWCIWNGSTWQKLDRAYQDAAYAYLPSQCPDDLYWSWQKGGHGALELGNKTITEAFDSTNIELKKLQPQKPSAIYEHTLSFKNEIATFKYLPLYQNGSIYEAGAVKEAISSRDSNSLRPIAVTPKTDDFNNLIYFGEKANIGFTIDGSTVATIGADSTVLLDKSTGLCKVTAPVDPYKDDGIGRGYWVGTHFEIGPDTDLADGSHTYNLTVSDTVPTYEARNGNLYEPFTFNKATPFDITQAGVTVASDAANLKAAESNGYCSGINKVASGFTRLVTVEAVNFTAGNIISTGKFFDLLFIKNGETEILDTSAAVPKITLVETENSRVFHATITDFPLKEKITDYEMAGRSYSLRLYNELGEKQDLPLKLATFISDPTMEAERVYSGSVLYPEWNPTVDGECGSDYNSRQSLASNMELLKRGRNLNGEFISEYSYPYGVYSTANTSIDYSNLSGMAGDDAAYRFATFAELDGSRLSEASGAVVCFNVASDNIDKWIQDNFNGVTQNLVLQARIVKESDTDDETGWLDCNMPVGAFDTPKNDGDPAMYAGSSTAICKRITFGRTPRTGRLVIRVGLAKASGMAFKSVELQELI